MYAQLSNSETRHFFFYFHMILGFGVFFFVHVPFSDLTFTAMCNSLQCKRVNSMVVKVSKKGTIKICLGFGLLGGSFTLLLTDLSIAVEPKIANSLDSQPFLSKLCCARDSSLHMCRAATFSKVLSDQVRDWRPRGRGFEPHRCHSVVVLEQDTFILA